MRAFAIAVAFGAISISTALAGNGDRLYDTGRSRFISSKSMPSSPMKRKAYLHAASDLRRFVEEFPGHAKEAEAYFNLGQIYRELALASGDRSDASSALHYFRELVARAPSSSLADDALYGIANICDKILNDMACRDEAVTRIQTGYAQGDVVRKLLPPAAVETSSMAMLQDIQLTSSEEDLTVELRLTSPRSFETHTLPAALAQNLPERYYIDIPNCEAGNTFIAPEPAPSDGVAKIRIGRPSQRTLRVVFDLRSSMPEGRIVAATTDTGVRVRFLKSEPVSPVVAVALSPTPLPVVTESLQEAPPSVMPAERSARPLRIVIDAGHGGEDLGAKGRKGTYEKDVALAMAKGVQAWFEKRSDYVVFMTRKDDTFIPLRNRTRMANAWGGDLFVSIHANASPKKDARGISTYFLDNADDAESLRVADRENFLLGAESAAAAATPEDQYLEIMKASMMKNFHTVQSTELARHVQGKLYGRLSGKFSEVHDLGVRSARFWVLTGAEMPAILVETSFISNPKEEKRLKDKRYQQTISEAVAQGIDQFLRSSVAKGDHARLYQP